MIQANYKKVGGLRETEAFVIGVHVGLASQKFRRQRTASGKAITVAVRDGKRCVRQTGRRGVIIFPVIRGTDVGSEVVLVCRAMEGIGSALGHHLDLAPGRTREISGLVAGSDLELL